MMNMRWKSGLIAMMVLALQLPGVAAAGGVPGFSSNPPPGPVACNGPSGSTVSRSIVITNTGAATLNIAGCAFASGVDFQVVGGSPAALAPGASGNVVVECHVPNAGDPAVFDTLACAHNSPNSPASYGFSSVGALVPIGLSPAHQVPASSALSNLLLLGLLAGMATTLLWQRRS